MKSSNVNSFWSRNKNLRMFPIGNISFYWNLVWHLWHTKYIRHIYGNEFTICLKTFMKFQSLRSLIRNSKYEYRLILVGFCLACLRSRPDQGFLGLRSRFPPSNKRPQTRRDSPLTIKRFLYPQTVLPWRLFDIWTILRRVIYVTDFFLSCVSHFCWQQLIRYLKECNITIKNIFDQKVVLD